MAWHGAVTLFLRNVPAVLFVSIPYVMCEIRWRTYRIGHGISKLSFPATSSPSLACQILHPRTRSCSWCSAGGTKRERASKKGTIWLLLVAFGRHDECGQRKAWVGGRCSVTHSCGWVARPKQGRSKQWLDITPEDNHEMTIGLQKKDGEL
jgi:hypothetical protein